MSPISDPWGVILIGVFISLVLYGIIVAQVFTYYQYSEKDPLWQKVFVGILFSLDSLSSALAMAWMYQLLIDNWGNIVAFESGDWLLGSDPMVAGVVAFMVQLFFAWRIHIIAGQPLLTMGIVACSFATLCGGIGTGIAVLWVKNYALFASFRPIAIVWLISATVGDISITVALTYHLRRRKGTFAATDRMLDRIVQLTIQNGLLTALVSIVDMTLYLSTPIPYHIALSFLMPKLYANTVLSSLNARRSLRPLGKITESGLGSISTTRAPDVVILSHDVRRPEVLVSTESHELTDVKNEWN
ncbi:hypothetical protein FIBSPDRAFT_1040088 [Athelia psychrophila]|uniref:DUF6534 domain-containing protein n=1 Tax=Athelia psychrophila TaxID=1759441 RepID=A0A166QTY9_9AGAM|nr:hypothetical protein FIBSPDRAFT_1040088 [Fibularhizoctonia sp. CBS 109695]